MTVAAWRVSCDAGYEGEDPRSFSLNDRVFAITSILDRWPGIDHRYYKIQVAGGDTYILRQDLNSQDWDLVVYDATNPRPT